MAGSAEHIRDGRPPSPARSPQRLTPPGIALERPEELDTLWVGGRSPIASPPAEIRAARTALLTTDLLRRQCVPR